MKKNLNETKRTLFQNIKDAFKKLYQIDKTTIWFLALSVVFLAISPFIFVLFPKFLLDELSSPQRNITIVILLIVGTALLILDEKGKYFEIFKSQAKYYQDDQVKHLLKGTKFFAK